MADIVKYLELKKALEDISQEHHLSKIEVMRKHEVEEGERILPTDDKYHVIIKDLNELKDSSFDTEVLKIYSSEDLWYHIENNLNLEESALVSTWLKR